MEGYRPEKPREDVGSAIITILRSNSRILRYRNPKRTR
jgi:hypothetical protein